MSDGLVNAEFPGGYSNQPDAVFTVKKKLERKEVMAEMQPLLLRLRGKWTDELAADIAATLTPQKLQVMEPLAKALLTGWIYQQKDQKYVQWLKSAEADMTSVEWGETVTILAEEYWASPTLMRLVLEEMDEAVKMFTRPAQRRFFEEKLLMIKMFVGRMEWHLKEHELLELDPDTEKFLMHADSGQCDLPTYVYNQRREDSYC